LLNKQPDTHIYFALWQIIKIWLYQFKIVANCNAKKMHLHSKNIPNFSPNYTDYVMGRAYFCGSVVKM